MGANIIQTSSKRVVIVGGGFGGLMLAKNLLKSDIQIVLIAARNYSFRKDR